MREEVVGGVLVVQAVETTVGVELAAGLGIDFLRKKVIPTFMSPKVLEKKAQKRDNVDRDYGMPFDNPLLMRDDDSSLCKSKNR